MLNWNLSRLHHFGKSCKLLGWKKVSLWWKYPGQNCYKEGEEAAAYCPQGPQSTKISCHLADSKQRMWGACWCWSEEFVAPGCDTHFSGFKRYYLSYNFKKEKSAIKHRGLTCVQEVLQSCILWRAYEGIIVADLSCTVPAAPSTGRSQVGYRSWWTFGLVLNWSYP